jgi:L,D-transpeptidase YcbB
MKQAVRLFFAFILVVGTHASAGGLMMEQAVSSGLTISVDGTPIRIIGDVLVEIPPVRAFLAARDFISVWVDQNGRVTPVAEALKINLQQSTRFGLDPANYWSPDMDKRWAPRSREEAVELELLLTQSFIQFASDVATGRVTPSSVDNEIDFKKREFKDFVSLNNFVSSPAALARGIESLEPQHRSYKLLKSALLRFLQVQENGGWPQLAVQKKLQKGMSNAAVPALRKRLVISGHIDAGEELNESPAFDQKLEEAVEKYQREYSLNADGVVGAQLYAALNVPVEKRIQQINATMEKWRWLPADLGPRHVFVNLARAELTLIDNSLPALTMKVVIGRTLRRTPSLSDKIVDVSIRPYWNVPQNLVVKDVLPGIKSDPLYFEKLNMKILTPDGLQEIDPNTISWQDQTATTVNFRFRQEPGEHNSLGVLKFNLTNSRAIYMHDTPHKELFVESQRNFSSGCVRLEKPLALATYLLKDQPEWSEAGIKKATNDTSYSDFRIPLKESMPVHLVFLTVSFSHDGEIRFNPDVYGQDERLIRAMKAVEVY